MNISSLLLVVSLVATVACSGQILDVGAHDGGAPVDPIQPDAQPSPARDAAPEPAASGGALRASCAAPHGSFHDYGTQQHLDTLLTARWYSCDGKFASISTPEGFVANAVELRPNGRYRLGFYDDQGVVTWSQGLDFEGTWLSGDNFSGPGTAGRMLVEFKSDLQIRNGGAVYVEPQFYDGPYRLDMGGNHLMPLP